MAKNGAEPRVHPIKHHDGTRALDVLVDVYRERRERSVPIVPPVLIGEGCGLGPADGTQAAPMRRR